MVCTDVDDDIYIFKNYGKALKHTPSWRLRARSNLIPWNSFLFQQELDHNFNIDSMIDSYTRRAALQIIKDNWDFFCEAGAARSMLYFEFYIATEDAK